MGAEEIEKVIKRVKMLQKMLVELERLTGAYASLLETPVPVPEVLARGGVFDVSFSFEMDGKKYFVDRVRVVDCVIELQGEEVQKHRVRKFVKTIDTYGGELKLRDFLWLLAVPEHVWDKIVNETKSGTLRFLRDIVYFIKRISCDRP